MTYKNICPDIFCLPITRNIQGAVINMKRKIIFSIQACFLILGFFHLANAQAKAGKSAVQNFIKRQAKKENASEDADSRAFLHGDINGDGKRDVIAAYTLEGFGGGNLFRQYLVVFLNTGKGFRYATHVSIGGKDNRIMNLNSLQGDKINFETLEYEPTDASCCPSKKGKVSFIFRLGKLKEI